MHMAVQTAGNAGTTSDPQNRELVSMYLTLLGAAATLILFAIFTPKNETDTKFWLWTWGICTGLSIIALYTGNTKGKFDFAQRHIKWMFASGALQFFLGGVSMFYTISHFYTLIFGALLLLGAFCGLMLLREESKIRKQGQS